MSRGKATRRDPQGRPVPAWQGAPERRRGDMAHWHPGQRRSRFPLALSLSKRLAHLLGRG